MLLISTPYNRERGETQTGGRGFLFRCVVCIQDINRFDFSLSGQIHPTGELLPAHDGCVDESGVLDHGPDRSRVVCN